MATDLAEAYRMQLDGIVRRMIGNQEPEENIQAVVADFKQKYTTPTVPSPLAAAAEPFKRAFTGLTQLPGAVAAGVRAVPQVDWADLLRHPGPLAETVAPMALPAAGAAIGSTVGPAGTVAGMVGGEFANEAIRQLWTGQPQAPLETLTRGATAGVLPTAIMGVGPAAKLLGRGAFAERPNIRAAFENQQVTPTAADVTGSRLLGQAEQLTENLPTSSGIVQRARDIQGRPLGVPFQKSQVEQAFERNIAEMGGIRGRVPAGEKAVVDATRTLERLQQRGEDLIALAGKSMKPGESIGSENLRKTAQRMYDEVAKANPGLRDNEAMTRLNNLASSGQMTKQDVYGTQPSGEMGVTPQFITQDLTELTLAEWYANNKELGRLANSLDLIAPIKQGRAKGLFAASMRDLESSPAAANAAVKSFKDFYKRELVPFNESMPGQLASGQVLPEDVGTLFSKRGIQAVADVKKYTPGAFIDVRNRWLGDMFDQAGLVHPDRGFQPTAFQRVWNKIDPEVKSAAFTPKELTAMDELNTVIGRIAYKYGPQGGANPSGTAGGVLPYTQVGSLLSTPAVSATAFATGHPVIGAMVVGQALVSAFGPRWLAKQLTTEAGIRRLTTAFKTPASSQIGVGMLGRYHSEDQGATGQ